MGEVGLRRVAWELTRRGGGAEEAPGGRRRRQEGRRRRQSGGGSGPTQPRHDGGEWSFRGQHRHHWYLGVGVTLTISGK